MEVEVIVGSGGERKQLEERENKTLNDKYSR